MKVVRSRPLFFNLWLEEHAFYFASFSSNLLFKGYLYINKSLK